jgi:dTDP-glucose 4,6-dehydratase
MNNILVTGGCGFIGSNFINYMVNKYPAINFINIDALYYSGSKNNIKVSDNKNYHFINGNINNYNLVTTLLSSMNISIIIHFAAQTHVDNSFTHSSSFITDNVAGTHTLLEAIRSTNPDILFIYISTDEVYGDSKINDNPKNEQDSLNPTNPYSASKAAAEMIVNSYKYSFKLKTIIVRSNNVYGPNQYPEKIMPKFINMLRNNIKCTVHSDGTMLRSFIHIIDVINALEIII